MREAELQAAFLLAAPSRIPSLRLFRRNTGTVRIGPRVVRFGVPGMSDLYGYFKGGRAIELELKAASGHMTPEQEAWRAFCEGWGVTHLVLKAKKEESVEETVGRWCDEILAV